MNRDWLEVAGEFARSVASALADSGGVDLARRAEDDPAVRADTARKVLAEVGLLGLRVDGDDEESAAAARGVQAAGAIVAPWPVAAELAVPSAASDVDGVFVSRGAVRRIEHADVFSRAVVVDIAGPGSVRGIVTSSQPHAAPLDPFGCLVDSEPSELRSEFVTASRWRLVLDAFWVLGALDTVVRQAARYSTERRQFGRPIGSFGEIRWRLADMVVARDGLDELARYTWWALRTARAGQADVLALRLAMIEAAQCVLEHGHQVFGAIGLCEEHDLAVIDRHLQPVLNRPCGVTATTSLLARAVAADGFTGTFPVSPR